MTRDEEIAIVHGTGEHIVLLGAGATYASTLRNPEKNQKELPLMKNIVNIVGLEDVVNSLPKNIQHLSNNFEHLYSKIFGQSEFLEQRLEIERRVYDYFKGLELPHEPTIYDYLILSLRFPKDIIATFNWDPFLYQAYSRNSHLVKSPCILFLHGCVAIGFDSTDGSSGPAGMYSKETKKIYKPTNILYPVQKKNYNSDDYIKGQWDILTQGLKTAERVTIFGYSAPVTDVEAKDLLQSGWGNASRRSMEQFEIIDVREENEVKNSWNSFIHSHHYNYYTDFFDSSIAKHPRRTIESFRHWSQPDTINEVFQKGNPVPKDFRTLEDMWEWFKPIIEAER